ncbi:MAG TPA: hypothetical protein VHK91_00420, partial [Flavisolibacter sp.]|nr:hypothetical protein [Flavisolibacter sp.]
MNVVFRLLLKTIVKPFYRENAGILLFVTTIFFFIVNKVDGAELYEFQYSLARAVLGSLILLAVAGMFALLYVRKCSRFLRNRLQEPESEYLYALQVLIPVRKWRLQVLTAFLLMIPLLLYGLFIGYVAYRERGLMAALAVLFFLLVLMMGLTLTLNNRLNFPGHKRLKNTSSEVPVAGFSRPYPLLLFRFVLHSHKAVWLASKLFTCSLLYLIVRNNSLQEYDTGPAYLFYAIGILSNGVLIYKIRMFEESFLSFYRSAPRIMALRLADAGLLMGLVLLPEAITILTMVPVHLHGPDALGFLGAGFSVLCIMNSLSLMVHTGWKDFLKILLLLLGIQYVFVLSVG